MTLSLPIVVGKKYVRRDDKVVTAKPVPNLDSFAWVTDIEPDWDDFQSYEPACVYLYNGRIYYNNNAERDTPLDLVSDYIEPAKGHPHAALIMEFAKDAAECERPWDRWEVRHRITHAAWETCDFIPSWSIGFEYRRKPTVTPDPHAENAAEYAKDMAVSDKAWEGWQAKGPNWNEWQDLAQHPSWHADFQYRRRPA